jgi:hypothetical protein
MPASFQEEQRLIRTLERTVRAMRKLIVQLGARADLNADTARLQLGILEGFTVALSDGPKSPRVSVCANGGAARRAGRCWAS